MDNTKLADFKRGVVNKKIAVLGLGVSNTPLVFYLRLLGADVTCFDRIDDATTLPAYDDLSKLNVRFHTGEGYLDHLSGFDIIFKTPVIRYDIAALEKAAKEGAEITSEIELFFELCPARIFGVTGSDGKTTTSTLIYNLLREEGHKCRLGGNIGTPLLDQIDRIGDSELIVIELSSFQLQTMKISPQVAVITNISPNHLDIHTSYEEYVDAKKNIFKFQKPGNKLVLNYANEAARNLAGEARGDVVFFNLPDGSNDGVFVDGRSISLVSNGKKRKIVDISDIALRGWHNVENYQAAIAATDGYVSAAAIRRVAASFKGVEHRLEEFAFLYGITFINDSIATSPSRTIAGLQSFDRKVILIAGGKDKNIDYSTLGKYILEYVKCLILIGETSEKIEKSLLDEIKHAKPAETIPVIKCESYHDVVKEAFTHAVPGDIVLLSPASTSFDQFRNFEERGELFKRIVLDFNPGAKL